VVFTGTRASSRDVARIFTLDLAGGVPREVTSGKADQFSRCTPDGSWLIYYSFEDYAIHKISVKGGAAAVLVKSERRPHNQFSITPDGKQLLLTTLSSQPGTKYAEFDFIALDSGRVERRIPVDANSSHATLSPDGKHVAFLRPERGVTNIWLQSIAGGEPTRLTDFHLLRSTREHIQRFGWSPDGKHLAVLRYTAKGNAVILQE
jgi:Tol biopolymer transport system component